MDHRERDLDLIDRIYAAALEPDAWKSALEALSDALGGAALHLSIRIPREDRNDPSSVIHVHLDPRYHEAFVRLAVDGVAWHRFDDARLSAGFVLASELGVQDAIDVTAFYREFMEPQGLAAESPYLFRISRPDEGPLAGMAVYRRKGGRPLDAEDLALLDALAPHLRRAYRIHCKLSEVRHQQLALREVMDRLPTGVLLLDKDARVVLANRSAEQILASADGIRVADGRPRLDDARQDRAFQQVLVQSLRSRPRPGHTAGSTLAVSRPSGRRAYPLTLIPLLAPPPGTSLGEAVAVLFVADPEGTQIGATEVLETLYDLTPAEAELLRLLAEGRSLEEVAALRRVTRNTVRSQLKQVFAKTGTSRQGELVHLVLTGVASFADEGGS
jgi:DNA-binding CsgD family transcriptional regulator/PAS domain-containing protein